LKRKEIESFIDMILESENCLGQFHVVFTFVPQKEMQNHDAAVHILRFSNNVIADGVMMDINRKTFTAKSKDDILYQKSCILHELGHVFTCSCRNSRREYRAHKWAHEKSIELGLYDVSHRIKKVIKNWECKDKSCRYYKAFVIAKNQNFI